MLEVREKCAMRHENGNCLPMGGFCTAVNDEICKALHNAFDAGALRVIEDQKQKRNKPQKQICIQWNPGHHGLPQHCEWRGGHKLCTCGGDYEKCDYKGP